MLEGAGVKRTLTALQAAALLVSASYGIGFLFGTGELALRWGMAGSIYAVATAVGMLLLSLFANRLWHARRPIWDAFGTAYGDRTRAAVALLSVLWMAGVLAAQVRGGVAVAELMGVSMPAAYALICGLMLAASQLELATASRIFSGCLFLSNAVLVYALVRFDGLHLYAGSAIAFFADLLRIPLQQSLVLLLAVTFLVVTGADYQQFVMAARSGRAGAIACVAAAAFLLVCGFLPASVVLSFEASNPVHRLPAETSQVMPFILGQVAAVAGAGPAWLLLATLLGAALGSGAAVTRAMTDAAASTMPALRHAPRGAASGLIVVAAALVALRGQAIVGTMVSLNIVYIASVALGFAALFGGVAWSPRAVRVSMVCGFAASAAAYAAGWIGWMRDADLWSLLAGLAASGIGAGWLSLRRSSRGGVPGSARAGADASGPAPGRAG
jgi:SSS family solute:Na+ symporter